MTDEKSGKEEAKDLLVDLVSSSIKSGREFAKVVLDVVDDALEAVGGEGAEEDGEDSPPAPSKLSAEFLESLRFSTPVFTAEAQLAGDSLSGKISDACRSAFAAAGHPLSDDAHIRMQSMGEQGLNWYVLDLGGESGEAAQYTFRRDGDRVLVARGTANLGRDEPFVVPAAEKKWLSQGKVGEGLRAALRERGAEVSEGASVEFYEELLMMEAEYTLLGSGPEIAGVTRRRLDPRWAAVIWDGDDTYSLSEEPDYRDAAGSIAIDSFDSRKVFEAGPEFADHLDAGEISDDMKAAFASHKLPLSDDAEVSQIVVGFPWMRWHIRDGARTYSLIHRGQEISVHQDLEVDRRFVDPVGDVLMERLLGFLPEEQMMLVWYRSALFGLTGDVIREMNLFAETYQQPERLMAWLRGQSDEIGPVHLSRSPQYVRDYFDETEALPAWADQKLLDEAAAAFDLYKIPYMMVLLCRALPETYACWRGAQVLAATGRLVLDPDQPRQSQNERLSERVAATAQFVLDVMSKDGFAPGGHGIRTTQVLRLVHAGVRFIVQNVGSMAQPQRPQWPYERFGEPINQTDMLMTLLAFSVVVFDGMKKLNVQMTEREEKALLHRWKVMGHYLGIREDLLAAIETPDDGRAIWQTIVAREQLYEEDAPTHREARAGINLTAALTDYIRKVTAVEMPREYPEFLVRFLIGDELADQLEVPVSDRVWPQAINTLWKANLTGAQVLKDTSGPARDFFREANDVYFRVAFNSWVLDRPVRFFEEDVEEGDSSVPSE